MKIGLPAAYEILFTPFQYLGIYGGRTAAKSRSVATFLVLEGRCNVHRILCVREYQSSLGASAFQILVDEIKRLRLIGFYYWTREGIFGKNGTQFLFRGLRRDPDAVRSIEGITITWAEEAQYINAASMDALLPTAMRSRSKMIFTFNRINPTDPVDEMFLGSSPLPNSKTLKVTWRDNPYLLKESYEQMQFMKQSNYEKYLHVWEGRPLLISEARVFKKFEVVGDEFDAKVPPGCALLYGADWGFSIDPTVLIGVYVFGKNLYIRYEAHAHGCTIDNRPALFAGNDDWPNGERWQNPISHKGLPDASRLRIIADSSEPATIQYMNDRGFNIVGAKKGPGSVEQGVQLIQSHNIFIHESCKNAQTEFLTYSHKIDKQSGKPIAELEDKNNHVIDATRYALENYQIEQAQHGRHADMDATHRPGLITSNDYTDF